MPRANQTTEIRSRNEAPLTVIRASRGWRFLDLDELWRYRELLFLLAWRDITVRYRQTVVGAAWAIIQPFFTMVVFSLFFGRLAKIPSEGVPYPIFSYTGLLPWTFFANGMNNVCNSLVGSGALVSKIYFPRLLIPMSAIMASAVDFALAFAVLVGMMLFYQIHLTWNVLFLLPFLLLALVAALGMGLWLAALNVEYRDVRYVVPFLTQLWMYATPVIYPSSLLHGPWRILLGLNPMTGVVEGFRWALLGTGSLPGVMFGAAVAAAAILLGTGILYFRRVERTCADVM
jgi:lipopolysaccharide transport system permease protein